jgi:hypothetical protein
MLAIIGWALSGTLGTLLWYLFYFFQLTGQTRAATDSLPLGEVGLVYSVHFVRQVGMAVVVGMLLRPYQPKRTDWFKKRRETISLLH